MGGGGVQSALRCASSSSDRRTLRSRVSASKNTMSPSCSSPMGPPTAASGATCPMHGPRDAPGEAPVGDEHRGVAQTRAHYRAGYRQHLLHARSALGTLVAHDHHIAVLDFAVDDGVERGALAVEHTRRALVRDVLRAGDLDDRAFRGEVALQDGETARRTARRRYGMDDAAVRLRQVERVEVLSDGLAGNRERIAMQQARVEQLLHHDGHAAGLVHVGHHEASARGAGR